MESISILGTGYLGFAFAKSIQDSFILKVSCRNEQKRLSFQNRGFESFILNENDFTNIDALLSSDYLLIAFPPSKSLNYLKFLENIYKNSYIDKVKKIIFVSSTSIYPKEEKTYCEEENIKNPSSQIVYQAEELIANKADVILRCAGLMGYDRVAGKYFENKLVNDGNTVVNYVHIDDVISAILFTIQNNLSGIYNLCSPIHPSKKEVYLKNAKLYNFKEAIFKNNSKSKNRIISSKKLVEKGFVYKYPNPLYYPKN